MLVYSGLIKIKFVFDSYSNQVKMRLSTELRKAFLIIVVMVLTCSPECKGEVEHRSKGGLFGSSWGFTPTKRCKASPLP